MFAYIGLPKNLKDLKDPKDLKELKGLQPTWGPGVYTSASVFR